MWFLLETNKTIRNVFIINNVTFIDVTIINSIITNVTIS